MSVGKRRKVKTELVDVDKLFEEYDREENQRICHEALFLMCPFCNVQVRRDWEDAIRRIYVELRDTYSAPMARRAQEKEQTLCKSEQEQHTKRIDFIQFSSRNPKIVAMVTADIAEGKTRNVCQVHRLREMETKATLHNWPQKSEIFHEKISERIASKKIQLDDIVSSVSCALAYKTLDETKKVLVHVTKTYQEIDRLAFRAKCNRITREMQYRPGYYGPRGTKIILAALIALYLQPPSFGDLVFPFDDYEFVREVLLPTCACLLVQEDMKVRLNREVSFSEALDIMQASADYGGILFPDY